MLSKAENSLKRFGEFYPHYDHALPYQTHALGVFSLNNVYSINQWVSQEVYKRNKESNR